MQDLSDNQYLTQLKVTNNKKLNLNPSTIRLISSVIKHKMNFYFLIEYMKTFKRDSTLHENITKEIAEYLKISLLDIKKSDTQKVKKIKIREHLSTIKTNICAIIYYENLISVNYKERNHMNLLFSIINTHGFIADLLIQIFEIYNINFKSREIKSIIPKPTNYFSARTDNGYQIAPFYDSLKNEEWIEHTYIYNAASDFIDNYYSQPIYSAEFYNRATKLGFDFDYKYGYDIERDIITRLLQNTKYINKDEFEFIELIFTNCDLKFNKEWIFKLIKIYSDYIWSDNQIDSNVAEYSDKFLEIIGKKYDSWLGTNMNYYNIEYILAPIMKISGNSVFLIRNKDKLFDELLDNVIINKSSSIRDSEFYNVRRLMLLEQLIKNIDDTKDYSKYITEYNDLKHILGKCKYSILCELKKYAIRYNKEKCFKGIEKIYIESPGYMQYSDDSKWLATVYGGPSVILPIIECDWNGKNSQFIKYMPDQDLVDEYRQMENERRYSNSGYDSDYSY